VIATIDRDGHVVSHTALAGEPFLNVTATATDFVAATAHAVSMIGPDGAVRASVTTDERIAELAVAGPRALAVIGRRTRRLALDPLAWGDWTPAAMTSIALSPDGTRAAGLAGGQAIAVDLATGKRVATRPATADAKLAFTDDDHVAIAGADGRLAWLRLRAGERAPPAASLAAVAPGSTPIAPALAVGGGRAFAAYGSDLAIATPVAAQYLGYRITRTWNTNPAPGGAVVGEGKDWAFLDAQLALVGRPRVWAPPGHEIMELAWLGGDDWLVYSQITSTAATAISISSLAHGTGAIAVSLPSYATVTHERDTPLVVVSSGGLATTRVLRYVATRHAFDTLRYPAETGRGLVHPVSPRLANRAQLVRITADDTGTSHLRWIRDVEHPDRDATEIEAAAYSHSAVDVAGHVYLSAGPMNPGLFVFSDGQRLGTAIDAPAIVPDPTGTRYLAVTQTTMALVTLDGKQLWSTDLAGGRPTWLDDGSILYATGTALQRVDPATGVASAPRCGFAFELATTPSRPGYATASVCAKLAARRDLPIEVPGNAVFKSLVRAVASTSGANILDWGTFPIAGRPRHAATIVREASDHQVIGYLIEVAPGSVVEVIVATDGFRTRPDYTEASDTEPGWVTRVAAAAAQRTDGTPHTDDGFELESTLPRFGEDFSFTLRDDGTPVLRGFSWYEMGERDSRTGIRDHTGDRKTYVKAGSCARCPVLANWKPHSAALAVRGPSRDPEALRLDDPKSLAP
jgi:hypothetical protein